MNNRLLPVGSSPLELAAAESLAQIERVPIPIRKLWNPDLCPVHLLPYLAWAFSVDRWDKDWAESAKRNAIKAAMFIHKHKGTIGALRRAVAPIGTLINVDEWFEDDSEVGTFKLDIALKETGINEETHIELTNIINDTKPVSRKLSNITMHLETEGVINVGALVVDGSSTTIYPYSPECIYLNAAMNVAVSLFGGDILSIYPPQPPEIIASTHSYSAVALYHADVMEISNV
ncbi:phage tail protein I [Providencia sp. PROV129]|uniref:phage tail protein I n=1 Tax=Providencia sp. PROV129 TaxID=2949839 RepID=UPI002349F1C6|nr:phage tail protein I [Providencia sp. PROV129]